MTTTLIDPTDRSEEILALARELTPVSDIALLLDIPLRDLREALDSDIPLAREYRRLRAQQRLNLRRQIIAQADEGDSAALEAVARFIFEGDR